jgi:hypothetical protein
MVKKAYEINKYDFVKYGTLLDLREAKLSSTSENHDYWDCISEYHTEGTSVCSFLGIKKSIGKPIEERNAIIILRKSWLY